MKIDNAKATQLLVGDQLVIAGAKFRVTFLNRIFGRKRDRVNIGLHPLEDKKGAYHCNLNVPAKARFNVTRKK